MLTVILCAFATNEQRRFISAVGVVWWSSVLQQHLDVFQPVGLCCQGQGRVPIFCLLLQRQVNRCHLCETNTIDSETQACIHLNSFIKLWFALSPSSTTCRIACCGCTAAACRGSQPLLSLSLKAEAQQDSTCSIPISPVEVEPRFIPNLYLFNNDLKYHLYM